MIPQVINKRNQNVFYVSREITRENGENTAKKAVDSLIYRKDLFSSVFSMLLPEDYTEGG